MGRIDGTCLSGRPARKLRVPGISCLAVAIGLAGCHNAAAPGRPEFATLIGNVLLASGAPLAGSTVGINCAGGELVMQVPTDTLGNFAANLDVPVRAIGAGGDTTVTCAVRAPATAAALAQQTVVVRLWPPGVPHPAQVISLRASS